MIDCIVVGGGAAGIFAAIAAKTAHLEASVVLLEKTAVLLAKVRVSGGGRCNVTHSCFDPALLAANYPRGSKELIGPFHRFQPKDTVQWFESRGVELKTEKDGRIFPVTDQSETIIKALLEDAKEKGVEIRLKQKIEEIKRIDSGFELLLSGGISLRSRTLILASGSNSEGHGWAEKLGHTIQYPVPSLFTFNSPSSPLKDLSGIAIDPVEIQIESTSLTQTGPILITHFGFSGPAVLKLSAWGARILHEKEYRFRIAINWLPHLSEEAIAQRLLELKKNAPQRILANENPFSFPKNFWKTLLQNFQMESKICDLPDKSLRSLASKLHRDFYQIEGKTTHKEEFVTCGGVSLKEVDFKTMQSKICPGLFFAGEILDIDGITGGFNFQNAWTTGFIAGSSAVQFRK